MKKIRNRTLINFRYFFIIFVIAFGLMVLVACGGGGDDGVAPTVPSTQPLPGEWTGSAGFGELSFIVDPTSTGITEITFTFYNFTCGGVTKNGSIKIEGMPWPIADRQFTIESTFDPNFEMTLIGTFDNTGTNVSGTFEAVLFGTTCSGTWDGGGGGGDPCAGSVPCLTTDWNGVFHEFKEADGSQILVSSEGNVFAGAGFTEEGWIIGLGGTPTDCYNGTLNEGGLDTNLDGVIDDVFDSVSGNMNICGSTLSITNLVLDGDPIPDIEATYVGIYQVAAGAVYSKSEIPPEILYETLDKVRGDQQRKINLLKVAQDHGHKPVAHVWIDVVKKANLQVSKKPPIE